MVAKGEEERMRTQPLPKAVDRFFKQQEDLEEKMLFEGYPSSSRRAFYAPDVERAPGKDVPSY